MRLFLRHPFYFLSAWYSNLMFLHEEYLKERDASDDPAE